MWRQTLISFPVNNFTLNWRTAMSTRNSRIFDAINSPRSIWFGKGFVLAAFAARVSLLLVQWTRMFTSRSVLAKDFCLCIESTHMDVCSGQTRLRVTTPYQVWGGMKGTESILYQKLWIHQMSQNFAQSSFNGPKLYDLARRLAQLPRN